MTELKEFLHSQLEAQAPTRPPDFHTVERRAVARRRRRKATIVVGSGAAVASTALLALQLQQGEPRSDPTTDVARPSATPSATVPNGPRGEVPLDGTFSCVEQYSASAIPQRGFAFDGTVTAIDKNPPATSANWDHWSVTFEVHEWFAGGARDSLTVTMFRPMPASDDRPAAYDVGTRLLVSGETQAGGQSGLEYLVWGCGFTRYYDAATAADWRAASS